MILKGSTRKEQIAKRGNRLREGNWGLRTTSHSRARIDRALFGPTFERPIFETAQISVSQHVGSSGRSVN